MKLSEATLLLSVYFAGVSNWRGAFVTWLLAAIWRYFEVRKSDG